MTARSALPLVPLCLAMLSACHLSARQPFDEAAAMFHDDLRWARLPTAEAAVDPAIRTAFLAHHRGWGTAVHVMDLEVESMRAASMQGTVRVRVVWTRGIDSTDVRESLVEESWKLAGTAWQLHNEAVIAGDAGLFGTPPTASGAPPPAVPPRDESVTPQG